MWHRAYYLTHSGFIISCIGGYPGSISGKELPARHKRMGLIPEPGRFPEGGHANPLQSHLLDFPDGSDSKESACEAINLRK